MSVKDFVKGIKNDFKDMVVNRHLGIEFNDNSEILTEFVIDEKELANQIKVEDYKQITFILERSLDEDEPNAWFQAILNNGDIIINDFELSEEDYIYLDEMVTKFLREEYGFNDILSLGESFKKMSGYILDIGDVDYSFSKYGSDEPNINFDIGFYDEFIHDFCDSFKDHDIYNNYREFYLSKNLDTGKLTLKEHLTNDDYEVDEWNDLTDKFSEDELKALWVCCRWDYEHSYNESFKDYEKDIKDEYEDYMKDEVER